MIYSALLPFLFSLEHVELPLCLSPTVGGVIGGMAVSAITRLPHILIEEEKEAYSQTHKYEYSAPHYYYKLCVFFQQFY